MVGSGGRSKGTDPTAVVVAGSSPKTWCRVICISSSVVSTTEEALVEGRQVTGEDLGHLLLQQSTGLTETRRGQPRPEQHVRRYPRGHLDRPLPPGGEDGLDLVRGERGPLQPAGSHHEQLGTEEGQVPHREAHPEGQQHDRGSQRRARPPGVGQIAHDQQARRALRWRRRRRPGRSAAAARPPTPGSCRRCRPPGAARRPLGRWVRRPTRSADASAPSSSGMDR